MVEVVALQGLTECEGRVLVKVLEGLPDKAIARALGISAKTVAAHLDRVYLKLDVKNRQLNARCAALHVALSRGILRISGAGLAVLLVVGLLSGHEAVRLRSARGRGAVAMFAVVGGGNVARG